MVKKAEEKMYGKLTVGVEDGGLEAHLRWQQRIFGGESETGAEETSCVVCEHVVALKV